MRRYFILSVVLAILLVSLSVADTTLSQESVVKASLQVSNDRCKGGVQISQIVFLKTFIPIHIQILAPPIEVAVGTTKEFLFELKDTPTSASIKGTIERQRPLDVDVPVGKTEYPCGIIQLSLVGAPPPPSEKPIVPGQSLEQVLQTLQLRGVSTRIEGSQDKPKLSDVSEPMLLRAIAGSSAQLIWISSPGTLRSVITWDNPAVDLDLIVFGFPGGFCFQLSPPGILAETCDRPTPVPGMVFAVLIINWSLTPQAYVLSLSP